MTGIRREMDGRFANMGQLMIALTESVDTRITAVTQSLVWHAMCEDNRIRTSVMSACCKRSRHPSV